MDSLAFIKKLVACVKEYRKQLKETRDDEDCAYFYDKNLKSFLKKHKEELDLLSTLNFDKSFLTFVKHYLFDKDED